MTSTVRDLQSEIITALKTLLAPVGTVEEGDVRNLFDVDDASLQDSFIVLQSGDTLELPIAGAGRMPGSVREQFVLNIIPATRLRSYSAELRRLRLAIKLATAGPHGGIRVQGVQQVECLPQTPVPPQQGRRWAFHVMPLQITYVQPLQ